jgi:hypothetical protein
LDSREETATATATATETATPKKLVNDLPFLGVEPRIDSSVGGSYLGDVLGLREVKLVEYVGVHVSEQGEEIDVSVIKHYLLFGVRFVHVVDAFDETVFGCLLYVEFRHSSERKLSVV